MWAVAEGDNGRSDGVVVDVVEEMEGNEVEGMHEQLVVFGQKRDGHNAAEVGKRDGGELLVGDGDVLGGAADDHGASGAGEDVVWGVVVEGAAAEPEEGGGGQDGVEKADNAVGVKAGAGDRGRGERGVAANFGEERVDDVGVREGFGHGTHNEGGGREGVGSDEDVTEMRGVEDEGECTEHRAVGRHCSGDRGSEWIYLLAAAGHDVVDGVVDA